MTTVQLGLTLQVAAAVVGVIASNVLSGPLRSRAAGACAMALGLAGVLTGAAAWAGPVAGAGSAGAGSALAGADGAMGAGTGLALRTVLPQVTLHLAPDRLGGAFLVLVGSVAAIASLSGISAATGAAASRTGWSAFLLFILGLQGVLAASDVLAFLLAWEVMAIASAVLVFADHARGQAVTSAGLWYASMTQLSFLLVLAGFGVLAGAAGGTGFDAIARLDAHSGSAVAGGVLLILGLSCKAGAVPLHVWLPKAHPEAPSHVSAVMSAAMVKAGVYGLLLLTVRLLPDGPLWWGLVILALGAASALFGILQASVAGDLKRLLAYSTTENVGLMLCAIGVAQVLSADGETGVAHVTLVAALLLAFSHAAAKTGLFVSAGAILHGSGERELDRLGGLWSRMPWTCVSFGIASLGAAALPVTAGFVAEWTLLQALIHGGRPTDPLVAFTIPVTVTVVALTAGLALLTFVKAFGIAFLGRARTSEAAQAHEVAWPERLAAGAAALVVLALGLVPGPLAGAAARAVGVGGVSGAGTSFASGIRLDGLGSGPRTVIDPLALTGCAIVLGAVVALVVRRAARRFPRRAVDLGWGCGGVRVSPRMQYNATSYAEPLVRVFDAALGVSRTVEATPVGGSAYLEQEVRFRQRLVDVVEDRAYGPLLQVAQWLGAQGRRVQNGSINRYLAFSFTALLVVLAVVTR